MPWYDGAWHQGDVVPFDIRDRGLLLGDGVFDTALVLGGRMVWRQLHVDRLISAGASLGFRIDPAAIESAIDAVVTRITQGSIRLTVTRGVGPRGLEPPGEATPMILATGGASPRQARFTPIDLHVSAIRRNETSPISRIKSLGYIDSILALREAQAAGCQEALLLNTRGTVACTSVGNVFALSGNRLGTPPLDDGVLDGIVRRVLLRTCDTLGLVPTERSLGLAELVAADAVFVTNSLRLLTPARAIGGTAMGTAPLSAIVDHLCRLVQQETGADLRSVDTAQS